MSNNITFMLWGGHAKKYNKLINKSNNHVILEYSHPSPIGDNMLPDDKKFKNCNHFKLVNIPWDTYVETRIYTDGAIQLDKKNASFAVLVGAGTLANLFIHGRVCQSRYIVENNRYISSDSTTYLDATSQRGEYLAMCYALDLIYQISIPPPVTIVTDSLNCLKTIESWHSNPKLLNKDLVDIMMTFFKLVPWVKIIHINSHQTGNDIDIVNNNKVDSIAKDALQLPDYDIIRSGHEDIHFQL